MKKRLFSILLALCMVLCLVPTTAFAESETEETPVCTCETACAAEAMNADCPICGAEGALAENCAKCAQPADAAAVQPEGEVSDPQPEIALTSLIGGNETVTAVSTADELTAAIADSNVNTVRLAANIDISNTLTVNRTVTLDLNGYALTVGGTELDIFSVDENGNLTVKDSGTGGKIDGQNKNCGFCIYGGVLTLESGTITNCTTDGDGGAVDISSGDSEGVYGKFVMNGGAITNCKVSDDSGAVDIGNGCTFIMNSGTISGCRADDDAGAIFIKGNASFVMNGGTIENCSAGNNGGAVKMRSTSRFTMNGGTISGCTAQQGGGVYVDGSSTFTMNDGSIASCTAVNGGNSVFVVKPSASFTMTGGTVDGSITMLYTVGNNTVYMDGLGTAAYPYQISTADQLKLFRDKVNSSKTSDETKICVVLTADIDLKNEAWTPIGIGKDTRKEDLPYSGTFDGNGHTISGLNVNYGDKNGGLFCHVKSATIKNLTVAGSVTYSSGDGIVYGGIVGCANSSTIENCTNRCTVTGTWYAGGIVGWSVDSDIIGCANFGNISSPFRSGGICGRITGQVDAYGIDATIRDCYNVGMVSGKYAGGITGQSDSGNIDILIANCYNVGSLHGSDDRGEIIGDPLSASSLTTIDNCYYLPTGNSASTSNRVIVKRTDSKTAAEFANRTVLALLKAGERDNNADPWADECQYLAAADKTLPVFNGQGDAHEHNGNWTSNGDGTHSRHCTCNAVETVNCSGGKATCTAKAACEVCKAEYGEKLPHDFTAETVNAKYLKSAATCTEKAVYYKSCAVCGLSSKGTADEATFFSGNALGHDWGDWTPSSNKTHTRTCKTDSTHTETKNCADDNKDHVCDTCGATLTQHSGGTASCTAPATCGYCGKPYGEKNPANHSDLKHVPAKAATTQAEGNSEYWLCSGCGKCYKDAAAATEIALSDTVIAKRIPRRYSGPTITVMGAAYYDGGNVGLTFVSSADFDTFTGVQVDGKTLAAKNYIAERGSIEVYLKAVYLRTLKNGSHTVTIQSTAGDVSAVFTVENSKTSPGTSDPGVAVYALSSMLSLAGLAALRRRKED